jgi:hypothetical protein
MSGTSRKPRRENLIRNLAHRSFIGVDQLPTRGEAEVVPAYPQRGSKCRATGLSAPRAVAQFEPNPHSR